MIFTQLVNLEIIRSSVKDGLAAAKVNALPGSILIICGVILVLLFKYNQSVHDFLNTIGSVKSKYGYAFSIPSTMLFGAIIPLIFRRIFLKSSESAKVILFYMIYWGYKGFEIDLFYRMQTLLWEGAPGGIAIVGKVIIDQLIYVPLFAVPSMIIPFQWKENDFSYNQLKVDLKKTGFIRPAIRLTLSNWLIWIPAVTIIYSFPPPLQLPLQNVTLAIWVMLLIILTQKKQPSTSEDKSPA